MYAAVWGDLKGGTRFAAGSLVANAPHLPVHLGAMSEAVRFQVAYCGPGGPGAAEGLQVWLMGHSVRECMKGL